uniref:Hexosyltransferase n=1 Tax=Cyprinus carpio TaxID=7962 RepID=A0A8C2IJL4_CYPCA
MRIAMLVSLIRPTGPTVVGISLGFTLSLLSVTWVDESCDFDWIGAADEMLTGHPGSSEGARKPISISTGTTDSGNVREDFEPRILPYNKPAQEGPPKKVFRAKYASTELGIHERLFVSVLTSKTTMNTLAVAINRTLNQHLSVQYLLDESYTQPERLKTIVSHLSMDLQLYMGQPREFIGGETKGRYCHSGPGFLLSCALLLKLQPFLEHCRTDIVSIRPDEWLGRCIIDYAGISCVDEYEVRGNNKLGLKFGGFQNVLTDHPVTSAEFIRLHKHFTVTEIQKTYEEIEQLQIKNDSELAVDGNKSVLILWPIGITPPFEPKSRSEVLRWDYFTEDNFFSCVDGAPKCLLSGADRDDVTNIIKLVNGYRRMDHTRGMEYTLDLQFQATTESGHQKSISRRVYLVRPLSQVEVIPMPYVTEATRVHIFLPLTSYDSDVALRFLDHCSSNLFLFTYEPAKAQKVSTNDIFAEVKAKITSIEHRYPSVKVSWISIKTDSPGVLQILDTVSRKHPVETLFLLVTADTVLNSEFLNRCRMNAIRGWQAFFPIHFQEFDPSVAYPDQIPPVSPDLVREAGHFDRYTFEEACFYNSDYMSSRTRMSGDLQENEELLESLDFFFKNCNADRCPSRKCDKHAFCSNKSIKMQ